MKTLFELLKSTEQAVATADQTARITALKEQLASTDYKVIKCTEFSLAGEELPYDISAVHAERQALRNEINTLEAEIAAITEQ